MTAQAAARNDPKSTFNPLYGVLNMKPLAKKTAILLAAGTASLIAANPALADGAGEKAIAELNEYAELMEELQTIQAKIANFRIKDSYCDEVHASDKRADRRALRDLEKELSEKGGRLSQIRRQLIHTVNRNQIARTALDQELDGGSGNIVDGSYFRPFLTLRNNINNLLKGKRDALKGAPEYDCGMHEADEDKPVIAVVTPLAEVIMEATLEAITLPKPPAKLCHRDEKTEFLDKVFELRLKAQKNTKAADDISDQLKELKADLEAKMAEAFANADAAAKSGDQASMNGYAAQHKAYKEALKKLPPKIRKADRQEQDSIKMERDLQKLWDAVFSMEITDCTDANLTPAGALTETAFTDLGENMPNPTVKPVDIPAVPTKVCVEQEKYEITKATYDALSNAWSNRDAWMDRIQQIKSALLKTEDAAVRARLSQARAEARTEASKWTKIHEQASAANQKALAIVVEDCSNKGGLLEEGKTSSALPGVHPNVPDANSKPYDLPEVPAFVCTYKEKQALIARAAAARETASYNHQQWAPRASALGKLLFEEHYAGADRATLIQAHAEARTQSDYWGDQMLNVSHKVYWDMQKVEIRDCDKKVSMAEPSTTKMVVKGDQAMLDRLGDARKGQPFFSGGQIPITGYPKFLDKFQEETDGFDGSEAEKAVKGTIEEGLKTDKPSGGQSYYPQAGGGYAPQAQPTQHAKQAEQAEQYKQPSSATPAEQQPTETPKTETPKSGGNVYANGSEVANKSGNALSIPMPDVVKTPQPGGPVPIPYPNTAMAPDTDKGTKTEKIDGLEIETETPEYREGAPAAPSTKQPGLTKFPDVKLGSGAVEDMRLPVESFREKNTPPFPVLQAPVMSEPKVQMSAPVQTETVPAAETPKMEYGQNLQTFSPSLRTSNQVETVEIKAPQKTETSAPSLRQAYGFETKTEAPQTETATFNGLALGLPKETVETPAAPKQEPKTFTATFGAPKTDGQMTPLKGPALQVKTWDGRTLGEPARPPNGQNGEWVQVDPPVLTIPVTVAE